MESKEKIIDYINKAIQVDASLKPIMRVKDYKDNILAPERYCYLISFICQVTNKRIRYSVFPDSVVVQVWNLKQQFLNLFFGRFQNQNIKSPHNQF